MQRHRLCSESYKVHNIVYFSTYCTCPYKVRMVAWNIHTTGACYFLITLCLVLLPYCCCSVAQIWIIQASSVWLQDTEMACRGESRGPTSWCQDNNLNLNISKTKELIVDYRKQLEEGHAPSPSNRLQLSQWLQLPQRNHISQSLTLTHHTYTITNNETMAPFLLEAKAQHGFQDTLQFLQVFHWAYPDCITTWCVTLNHKPLKREVRTAQNITRMELPSMEDIYIQQLHLVCH